MAFDHTGKVDSQLNQPNIMMSRGKGDDWQATSKELTEKKCKQNHFCQFAKPSLGPVPPALFCHQSYKVFTYFSDKQLKSKISCRILLKGCLY